MSLTDRVSSAVKALMGISAYHAPDTAGAMRIEDKAVEAAREATGGQLQPVIHTQQKWFLADLERASTLSEAGDMSLIGMLRGSMVRDGMIRGLTETRTSGLVALPKRWFGNEAIITELSTETASRSVFDEMCPAVELAMLAADEMICGVGVAELVPVPGRAYPVMVRLDPSFLYQNPASGNWYYRSRQGLLLVEPGLGRWVLHTTARQNPWKNALWSALGRAFIHKEHAMLHRGNFSGKLANPARLAFAALAATEPERQGFLRSLIQWGINTVIELPPGWDAKLLESNGRGWEVFGKEIDTSDLEIMITLAGQVVTVTGGTGFANADIHQTIKADLINLTANALAHTLNTQVLPVYVIKTHGIDALTDCPRIAWDTDPPADRETEGKALTAISTALDKLRTFLAASDKQLDEDVLLQKFGIPVKPGQKPLIDKPMSERESSEAAAEALKEKSASNDNDKRKAA